MDSDSIGQILFIAMLILMSAYFSASETAFFSMNKIRMKNMASNGSKRAELVLKLAENYDKLLSSILIGNNIVNIASSSIATVLFVKWLGNTGVSVSTAAMTVIVLIFGEITPKSLAKNMPERFALFSAPILRVINIILSPLNLIFSLWQKLVYKVVKPPKDRGVTEEELLTMVEEAQNDGEINPYESELIRNAIEFNDIEVIDIHTNRVDVIAVDLNTSNEEIERIFREHGYSRLPVYKDSIDNIVGILNQKDFNNASKDDFKIKKIMNTPVFVVPAMKISQLLTLLQKKKSHMAVIIDEYGGTVGIVTLEDILEELVGEIWDEHDEVIENIKKIGDNKYKVLCSSDLDNMFETFNVENEFDIATVGGWVIQTFERIPEFGESFDYKNLHITVSKRDNRHIIEITVEIIENQSTDE
ncbi:MAG: HlyC/CorC family transporter [Clostridia bacterium]|nr:HlyC/CorC family transporter [Clostridia bacterium]MCI9085283.1 HlyC/CorC family transporter [Clostridia bacterium]NDO19992.1 HlyC/CorC family transporter [Lachnospiraceae bacterium MD329]